MKVLITAGPTREPIDPVRYLSNRSTGVMGCAIAAEAHERGHDVTMVYGPAERQPPVGVGIIGVESAREMLAAMLDLLEEADVVICAAAVADYRPAQVKRSKIKRGGPLELSLVENPDIAAEIGKRREHRRLAVFALETESGIENARAKIEKKNADVCVLNSPDAIGAESGGFALVRSNGEVLEIGQVKKRELAAALCDELGL